MHLTSTSVRCGVLEHTYSSAVLSTVLDNLSVHQSLLSSKHAAQLACAARLRQLIRDPSGGK